MKNYAKAIKEKFPTIKLTDKQAEIVKLLDELPVAGGKTFLVKLLSTIEESWGATNNYSRKLLRDKGIVIPEKRCNNRGKSK